MKNPFKPDRSAQDRDNPVVPNVLERPVERAADRAATHDNPLVPNAIERPVERAVADERSAAVNRPDIVDRPGIDDGQGDRRELSDSSADIARGRATPGAPAVDRTRADDGAMELFPNDELGGYRTRWESIQAGFVDQPRAAVEEADALVSQVVTRLTEVFTRERSTLESQWTKGSDVST